MDDTKYMQIALAEAKKAFDANEIPVGAVIVCGTTIVARAHNYTERLNDATAHAEMQAITAAANYLDAKYLKQCTLYVTLEPCTMCAGAAYWAQIGRVVYGASDTKRGFSCHQSTILHPKTKITTGIMAEECSDIMNLFFKNKR